MTNSKNLTNLFIVSAFVFACAPKAVVHNMRVEGGAYKVDATHHEENTARNAAIEAGKKECQALGKSAVFKEEKKAYNGTFNEKTDKAIEKAGKVGWMLGSAEAGTVGHGMSRDNQYTIAYEYRCE